LPFGSWSLLPLTVSWGSALVAPTPPEPPVALAPPVALEPPLPPVAVLCEPPDEQAAAETAVQTRAPTMSFRGFRG
jgi:hypothetical protein